MAKNNDNTSGFLREALIISLSNFVVKIIGVLYKIPLVGILDESMGIFTAAYSIYAMLYMVSTSGLPVAISRLVASSNERGRQNEAGRIFKLSIFIFGFVGLICALFLFFCADGIASWSKHDDAATAMRVISPTLFFVCIASAIRGYFQGYRNMYPTAISQFIEAFFKLVIGLGGAYYARYVGYSPVMQAAFAISGLTVGVMLGTVFLALYKSFSKKKSVLCLTNDSESSKTLTKKIALIALPVTLTSSALYLSQFLDTLVIKRCLISSGLTAEISEKLYTAYTALAVSISDLLPSTLVYPIAVSILPAVAGALAVNNAWKANNYIVSSIRISSIIALPCSFCLAALARPCISLIYGSGYGSEITLSGGSVMPIDVASTSLSILALGIFLISLVSTTTALLQACGKTLYALFAVLTGVAFLIIAELSLVSMKSVGIYGAPTSSIICYAVALAMNMFFLSRCRKLTLSPVKLFFKPALCAVLSGTTAFVVYRLSALCINVDTRTGSLVILAASGIAAVAVYAALMLLFKAITPSEVRLLPFGNRMADYLVNKNILKEDADEQRFNQ